MDYTPVSLGGARRQTAVVWYRDDEVQGVEEFLDPAEAEDWAAELRDRVAVDRTRPAEPQTQSRGWIT